MRAGFSLVELVITVAIVGILAAIAIPALQTAQLRARRAEATTILRGIGVSEVAHFTSQDSWMPAAANPPGTPGKAMRTWSLGEPGWTELGFFPDGPFRCSYSVALGGAATNAIADATCDVDGDGNMAVIAYTISTGADPGEFDDRNPDWF